MELQYPTASVTSYYLFGGQRVAMNKGGTLTYLHGDRTTDVMLGLIPI
ncbi:MAG: hypothetical protein KIH69_012830 [Anaerolineae bacterium]|nr:hypothetical protein [Anaerolineae bacterium]